jgi:hypothetical protein
MSLRLWAMREHIGDAFGCAAQRVAQFFAGAFGVCADEFEFAPPSDDSRFTDSKMFSDGWGCLAFQRTPKIAVDNQRSFAAVLRRLSTGPWDHSMGPVCHFGKPVDVASEKTTYRRLWGRVRSVAQFHKQSILVYFAVGDQA